MTREILRLKPPSNIGIVGGWQLGLMPGGIPVATVGINNAKNAGILAARMVGRKYPEVRERLEQYVLKIKENVVYDLEDKLKLDGSE